MTPTSYDVTPYGSFAFAQTHPDRLATVATLVGLTPAPVESCRVLELGCASGGNLLPMADALPGSRFVGIDLSGVQIEQAKKDAAELGIKNVEYLRLDIADAGEELGRFDYVLCHGVYSWVPPSVQDRILGLCRMLLNPDGIGYVSYNTLPGWRMRGAARDMMHFHAQRFDEPRQKVEQALGLLEFLAHAGGEGGPFTAFLRSEVEMLRQQAEWYVLHEHLDEHNVPLYFHEFLKRARSHGLRYVGEADVSAMLPLTLPADVREVLDRLSPDQAHLEQYMDFVRNRMFRQTLLCHEERVPDFSRMSERLMGLQVASQAIALPDNAGFDFPGGLRVTATDPLVHRAIALLGERWPASIPFNELLKRAGGTQEQSHSLASSLWQFYGTASGQLLDLSPRPFAGTAKISECPVARPLARWQASRGNKVATLRHTTATLGEEERQLLLALDGTHRAEGDTVAHFLRAGLLIS